MAEEIDYINPPWVVDGKCARCKTELIFDGTFWVDCDKCMDEFTDIPEEIDRIKLLYYVFSHGPKKDRNGEDYDPWLFIALSMTVRCREWIVKSISLPEMDA